METKSAAMQSKDNTTYEGEKLEKKVLKVAVLFSGNRFLNLSVLHLPLSER